MKTRDRHPGYPTNRRFQTLDGEPLKSAWLFECVANARGWPCFRGKPDPPATTQAAEALCTAMPELRDLWGEFQQQGFVQDCPDQLSPDRALMERHARVVRDSGELFTQHPTYWGESLRKAGAGILDGKPTAAFRCRRWHSATKKSKPRTI